VLFCPSYCSLTFFLFCAPECQELAIRADESKQRAPFPRVATVPSSSSQFPLNFFSSQCALGFLLLLLIPLCFSLVFRVLFVRVFALLHCGVSHVAYLIWDVSLPKGLCGLLLACSSHVPLAFLRCFPSISLVFSTYFLFFFPSCSIGYLSAQGLVSSTLGVLPGTLCVHACVSVRCECVGGGGVLYVCVLVYSRRAALSAVCVFE
jgi:hypothetical protein